MSTEKRLIAIGLLALTVASAGIPKLGAAASGARVRIEPADSAASLGESFVVQVVIEEANDLGGFQFDLVYDPSVVQVTQALLGGFLESTGRSAMAIGPEVDNVEGKLSLGAVSFGSAAGPSGAGVLAAITCIAHGEGSTALALQEVQTLDTMANPQPVTVEDGRVVVGDAATPTPPPTATPAPAATDTPTPPPTATASPPATATPMPTNTPEAVDTLTPAATAPPSPTPTAASPTAETPTAAPLPSPTPSASIAPTETQPAEVTPIPLSPTAEAAQTPTTVTTAPTSPADTSHPLSPSPTPPPSPTPLATLSVPAAKGASDNVALGLALAALAAASLVVFLLRRRPGG